MRTLKMKTAIAHDVFLHLGGAERVLLTLIKLFPQADIYVPLLKHKYIALIKKEKHKGKIITSFFNLVPLSLKYASLLKPFIFWYWKHLDLSDYDLVISSSHSFSSKSVITKPKTLHLSYIHTPPKYLYGEYNEMQFINKPLIKIILSPLLSYLRRLDYLGSQRPDILVANSKTVQKRIRKYYKRKGHIIYPPIKMPGKLAKRKKSYYLFFSRLSKQKGGELAIKAFNTLGKKLVVVGTGPEEKKLKRKAKNNIIFKGFVDDTKILEVYSRAKALIYCSIDEDFGIVPVEAIAHGVPVIAFNSGGVSETTIEGKTGVLFNNYSVHALKKAILKFERMKFSSTLCQNQAKKFSEETFKRKLMTLVNKNLNKNG